MGLVTRKKPQQLTAARLEPVEDGDAALEPCTDCGRLPLIGERIARYRGGVMRCELCRTICHDEPQGTELVKHSADGPRSRVRVIRRLPV